MAKLKPVKRIKHEGKTVAVIYEDGHVRIDNVRLSYPHLATPQEGDDGSKKFGATFLLDKDIHSETAEVLKDLAAKTAKNAKVKVPSSKYFIKDGDEEFSDKPECENMFVISAREKKRPVCRDADKEEIDVDDIEEILYGGCYVSALIGLWVQDNKYGKRVNANLRSIKFIKDGEPFGAERIDDSEAWYDEDEWGEDEDDDI